MSGNSDTGGQERSGWLPFGSSLALPLAFPIAMLAVLALNLYSFVTYQQQHASRVYFLRAIGEDEPGWRPLHRRYWFYYAVQDRLRGSELVVPVSGESATDELLAWTYMGLVDAVPGPALVVEEERVEDLLASMQRYSMAIDPAEERVAQMRRRVAETRRRRSPGSLPPLTPERPPRPETLWLPAAAKGGERLHVVALKPETDAYPRRFVVLPEVIARERAGSAP